MLRDGRIELRPLTDAQQQDALFQVYNERNIDKVGGAFRLPRLLRGESKDFNRATAESALRFAEDQDRRQLLIAYHLCCPRCGFVNAVFHQHKGQVITEHEDGERVSFSAPVRCVFCNVTLHVTDSVAEFEEGPDVRNVRYP